jgi:hypothetical protein
MTPKVIWEIVKQAAQAPHDLRRYAESRTMPNRSIAASLPDLNQQASPFIFPPKHSAYSKKRFRS